MSAGVDGRRPSEYGAQISPDGSRVAFLSTAGGSPQIHICEAGGGASSPLTDLVNPPKDLSWSPDGRWLAFHADVPSEPLPFAKSMTSAPAGCEWAEPPYLTDQLPYKLDGVGFLPRTERHLFIVSATGGMPLRLTKRALGFGLFAQKPVWTPDGERILVIGSSRDNGLLAGRYSDLFEIDVTGKQDPVQLTRDDGMVVSVAVSPDGSMVAFASAPEEQRAHGHTGLFLLNLATGEMARLGEYPELYLHSGEDDEPRGLTELNEALRRQHPVGDYEELWVENPADGQSIHAWLVKPADFDPSKTYPLILDIHGGPHADYGDRFWMRPQTLAGRATAS